MRKIISMTCAVFLLSSLNLNAAVTRDVAYHVAVIIPPHVDTAVLNYFQPEKNDAKAADDDFVITTEKVIRNKKPVIIQTITTK